MCAVLLLLLLSRTNGRYVEMTSVHWYKATSETFHTAESLLDEDPIRKEMDNLKTIVNVSNRCVTYMSAEMPIDV